MSSAKRIITAAVVATLALAARAGAQEPAPSEATRALLDMLGVGEDVANELSKVNDREAAIAWIETRTLVTEDHSKHANAFAALAKLDPRSHHTTHTTIERWLRHKSGACQLAAVALALDDDRLLEPLEGKTIDDCRQPAQGLRGLAPAIELARRLVALVASQRVDVSEKASVLLEKLSGARHARDVDAWQAWIAGQSGAAVNLPAAAFEILAGVGKLPDAWVVNGQKFPDARALAAKLAELERTSVELGIPFRVYEVEVASLRFGEVDRQELRGALGLTPIAGTIPCFVEPPHFRYPIGGCFVPKTENERFSELALDIDTGLDHVEELVRASDIDGIVARMTRIDALMSEYRKLGREKAEPKLKAWERRLGEWKEIRLAIKLKLYVSEGDDALRTMVKMKEQDKYDAVLEAFASLKDLSRRMHLEEREEFHKNADAFLTRGQAFADEAAKRKSIAGLVLTGIFLDARQGDRAIIVFDDPDRHGRIYVAGDFIRNRDDKLTKVKLVRIVEGSVKLDVDGLEVIRELKAP